MTLEGVLLVPSLANRLFSVRAVDTRWGSVQLMDDRCLVWSSSQLVRSGRPDSQIQYEVRLVARRNPAMGSTADGQA